MLTLIILFPVLTLIVQGGANTCLYVFILLSLGFLIFYRKENVFSFSYFLRKYWSLHLAMAGIVLAILANQLSTSIFIIKTYDIPSRLAFFLLVAWILLQVPGKDLKLIQWGIVIAAIAAAIKIGIAGLQQPEMPSVIGFMNRIPYGDVSLLFGIFSILSIGWNKRGENLFIILKVIAGFSGLYASYLSETRGGWIALPVLAILIFSVLSKTKIHHKLMMFAIFLVLMFSAFHLSKIVNDRVHEATSDIINYVDGKNINTSVGVRFQLWYGSWVLFKEHPIFGVGREEFYPDALQDLAKRNVITKQATEYGHSHNEFFYNMATLGILGLIATLAIFLVPGYFFLKATIHPDREIKTAGSMGLALCLGFLVFGLTEAIFFVPAICAFFCMTSATFFAFIVKRKQLLAG